ncbi:hypothetical protein [Streptomyces barkulensis]|uniref:hypothetical protein n=1 Tax=Streptomyces barkulensis TaxID=1257026 RepID=UPI000C6CBD1B|nr:hypothetical protein [Streptomyces barkulensis]
MLPDAEHEQVFSRIARVLPETLGIVADITVHLARRREERQGLGKGARPGDTAGADGGNLPCVVGLHAAADETAVATPAGEP